MSEAARPPMIYGAISAAMADITAVGKDKLNQQQGFKFRGIDDVMNAMKPVLAKHQIFTVPTVLEQTRETKTTRNGSEMRYSILKMAFSFYAPDGSHVDAVTLGEGMDSGDKASNKAMAIAYKYALFQVFCIPTEEMIDPDAETPEPTKAAESKPAESKPAEGKPQAAAKNAVKKSEKVPFDAIAWFDGQCKRMGISLADFARYRKQLIDGGAVEDIPSAKMTQEQAKRLVEAVERNFSPDVA